MPSTPASTSIDNDDLVLRVKTDYDPSVLRLDAYEGFLDRLCGDREYQKEAIRTACRFLAGKQYSSTADLAAENFSTNERLAQHYGSLGGLRDALPFPDKLACDIDLATGTGKSWVMYGIAQILLVEGVVDRVLVLCPSLTIESGLRAKFSQFVSDPDLKALLPPGALVSNPEVVSADITTQPGDICIENIDATYKHVRSSVRDSFGEGRGATTLVLNDECHHVYSPPTGQGQGLKRWKEFLDADEFGFHRIVGLSGTPYVDNDYIADIVYRYPLRQAMEDGRVKDVRYVVGDDSTNQAERFQKYLGMHRKNQARYASVKPLSIIVTGRISTAVSLADELASFLAEAQSISVDDAAAQVLVVTSSPAHKGAVAQLPHVDDPQHPAQWIVSVSKLTEGWDVQNVFQIIPHEKRAFASKLLIAQVLGRGLRVPPGMSRPSVWVFNHASWSSEIASLVEDVLEQERRIHSRPVDAERDQYHFRVHQLTYKSRSVEQDLPLKDENGQVHLFKRGWIAFESQPPELVRETVFTDALRPFTEYVQTTTVHYAAYSIEDAVQRLRNRLKSIDLEAGTSYAAEYTTAKLMEIIRRSLSRIGETRDIVSEANLQNAFRALGNTRRKMARTVRIEHDPDQLLTISTADMRTRSVGISSLRREATVFYDSLSAELSEDGDRRLLNDLVADDSPFPRHAAVEVANKYWFKTPVNVVLTSHSPERQFVRRLLSSEVADRLYAWVKSPDAGFYEIAFSWRKGDHTKLGRFNPDFFVQLADERTVLVLELKADSDDSEENRAKLRYAQEHFSNVNDMQSGRIYVPMFLSPASFDPFFQALENGEATGFVSALQAELSD